MPPSSLMHTVFVLLMETLWRAIYGVYVHNHQVLRLILFDLRLLKHVLIHNECRNRCMIS